jgi:hypothetical protein
VDVWAKKVTWKLGVDSHSDLVKLAGYKDNTYDPRLMEFAKIEITPENNDYLNPDSWIYRVDESPAPMWIGREHEAACFKAHVKWLKKLDKFIIRHPVVHPFKLTAPEVGPKQIALLKKWDSVRDSVRDSVGASVGDSVWDSVWDSVRDSVRAYAGSFFKIPVWKYVKHPKGKYPYQPLVQLWNQRFVPSFDGTTWRLHAGPKAKIVFTITAKELKEAKSS